MKEKVQDQYFQISKLMFGMWRKKEITGTAYAMYTLMTDRFKLSLKNGWKDKDGVYILYSYEKLKEDLNIKRLNSISGAIKELENVGFIVKKKGFNKANKYYRGALNLSLADTNLKGTNTNDTNISDTNLNDSYSTNLNDSYSTNLNVETSNNNINNNNYSNNNIYIEPPLPESKVAMNKGAYLQTITLYCSGLDVNPRAVVRLGKSLDRVKEVTDYGRENNWEGSWIYAALRDDRDLNGIKKSRSKTSIEELEEVKYTPSKEQIELDKLIGLD